ncbi:unnamed protein product, partial [Nesidiocoris tenuis]
MPRRGRVGIFKLIPQGGAGNSYANRGCLNAMGLSRDAVGAVKSARGRRTKREHLFVSPWFSVPVSLKDFPFPALSRDYKSFRSGRDG